MSKSRRRSNKCKRYSGAGVLVIEVSARYEPMLVVFRDVGKDAYTEPGGKCERRKHRSDDHPHGDPLYTAMDELFEETAALIDVGPDGDALSPSYIEKEHRGAFYRALFLVTTPLDPRDYANNVRRLKSMNARKYWQETDDMAKIGLSEIIRRVQAGKKSVIDSQGRRIRLHKRTRQLLSVLFEYPERIHEVLRVARLERYRRVVDEDEIVRYEY